MTLTEGQFWSLIVFGAIIFGLGALLGFYAAKTERSTPACPPSPPSPDDIFAQLEREVPANWRWHIARDGKNYSASISYEIDRSALIQRKINIGEYAATSLQGAVGSVLKQLSGYVG